MLPISMATSYRHLMYLRMKYLESKNVVYRDLAARNVLKYRGLLKVIGFGLSRALTEEGDYSM